MAKRILLQLDGDAQPSSFDSVVAIDAGVDQLLPYGGVRAAGVETLVHGAMFTRGGDDLKQTAIFIGGSDVEDAEQVLLACQRAFFGPVRVSLMLDASGCNTTAAAAVVAAGRHTELAAVRATVLAGTGAVGRRVAQLLCSEGADVTVTSRRHDRAAAACDEIREQVSSGRLKPLAAESGEQTRDAIADSHLVVGCGAAGVELVSAATLSELDKLAVAIDLNAVPPAGLGGIEPTDKAKPLGNGVGYGAIGVGGLKMKTHRAAIEKLFSASDLVLDAQEIYEIAKDLDS